MPIGPRRKSFRWSPRALVARSMLAAISVKDLSSRPFRIATFIIAIALGVALVTATQIATQTVLSNFNAQLSRVAGRADLQITFGTGEVGFPEELVLVVQAQPYVRHAAAIVRGVLTCEDDRSHAPIELFGVDLLQDDIRELYGVDVKARTADDFTIINDPYAIFLTEKVAAQHEVGVGDTLRLGSVVGVHEYTVRGILSGSGLPQAYEGRLAAMYLPAAQQVLGQTGESDSFNVDQIDVVIDDTIGTVSARERLAAVLPDTLVVSEPEQRKLANERLVGGLRATLLGISVFALLAAMFIVYSTTAALVTYRTPMLGTLVTIGATPAAVGRLVLLEATLLGLLAGCIGTALGLVMARHAMSDVAVGMSLNYSMNFTMPRAAQDVNRTLLMLPLLGAAAAMVSAYAPARRLRRLDPLALQRVGISGDASEGANGRLLAISLLLGAVGFYSLQLGARTGSPGLSSTGTTLLATATVLGALPIARVSWLLMRAPARALLQPVGWLAIEHLNRNVERSLVTVAAIALSIGVVLTTATLPRSFRASVAHWYGFYGDAIVASRIRQGGWMAAPVSNQFVRHLRQVDGVERIETLRIVQGQEFAGDRIAVSALSDGYVSRALETASSLAEDSRTKAERSIVSGTAIAISENMLSHYQLDLGDVVEIDTPTGRIKMPVAAIVPDFVSDRGSILLGNDIFRERWRDDLVNYYAVFLDADTSVEELRANLIGAAGRDASIVSVLTTSAVIHEIDTAIERAFADVDALQILVIAITLAGIVDLVVSNVLDRRRLHAMLRIAGTTDRGVLAMVVFEGAIVGLTAGLIGVAIGMMASWTWVSFTYPVLVGYVLTLSFAWVNALACVALATLTALLAGGAAGYLELRHSPTDAVRIG